jgi:hypothetical protein
MGMTIHCRTPDEALRVACEAAVAHEAVHLHGVDVDIDLSEDPVIRLDHLVTIPAGTIVHYVAAWGPVQTKVLKDDIVRAVAAIDPLAALDPDRLPRQRVQWSDGFARVAWCDITDVEAGAS